MSGVHFWLLLLLLGVADGVRVLSGVMQRLSMAGRAGVLAAVAILGALPTRPLLLLLVLSDRRRTLAWDLAGLTSSGSGLLGVVSLPLGRHALDLGRRRLLLLLLGLRVAARARVLLGGRPLVLRADVVLRLLLNLVRGRRGVLGLLLLRVGVRLGVHCGSGGQELVDVSHRERGRETDECELERTMRGRRGMLWVLHSLVAVGCLRKDVGDSFEIGCAARREDSWSVSRTVRPRVEMKRTLVARILGDECAQSRLQSHTAGVQLLDVIRDAAVPDHVHAPKLLEQLVKLCNLAKDLVLVRPLAPKLVLGRTGHRLDVVDGEDTDPPSERASPPLGVRPPDDLDDGPGFEGKLGRVGGRVGVESADAESLLEWRGDGLRGRRRGDRRLRAGRLGERRRSLTARGRTCSSLSNLNRGPSSSSTSSSTTVGPPRTRPTSRSTSIPTSTTRLLLGQLEHPLELSVLGRRTGPLDVLRCRFREGRSRQSLRVLAVCRRWAKTPVVSHRTLFQARTLRRKCNNKTHSWTAGRKARV